MMQDVAHEPLLDQYSDWALKYDFCIIALSIVWQHVQCLGPSILSNWVEPIQNLSGQIEHTSDARAHLSTIDSSYEPEIHPGATVRLPNNAVLKVFTTGSVTLTGTKPFFLLYHGVIFRRLLFV